MPRSAQMTDIAKLNLAGGVTSSCQSPPAPDLDRLRTRIPSARRRRQRILDFHGGYGAMLAGHAHPAIVKAINDRLTKGTHFAQPVEDAMVVAQELALGTASSLGFGNSGTESTMDAVHLRRAFTGRDVIVKFEGVTTSSRLGASLDLGEEGSAPPTGPDPFRARREYRRRLSTDEVLPSTTWPRSRRSLPKARWQA